MATKPQQLHKLIKIRATLEKFKLSVKSVDSVLENLLKRDKPPLDAKLLGEIESILQVREYLKSSRLQTTEIDRGIGQLLEVSERVSLTGDEKITKARTLTQPSPPVHWPLHRNRTRRSPNKAARPEPNPKKRTAATPSSSEPLPKKPRPQPATSPRTAKGHISPGKPSMQSAKATVPPWPLKSVTQGANSSLIADENCSPVRDIDPQGQNFRVYDQKKRLLNQGAAAFKIQASTITQILNSRPDKQILIRCDEAKANLRFVSVKYLDQVVSAIEQKGNKLKAEHSRCSSWPRLKPVVSEQDLISQVKKEAVQCKDGKKLKTEANHAKG